MPSTILYIRPIETDVYYAISEYFRLMRERKVTMKRSTAAPTEDRLKLSLSVPARVPSVLSVCEHDNNNNNNIIIIVIIKITIIKSR